MTINCPDISDKARLSTAQAARVLEVDVRTLKKYAALLCISRHERAVGGLFFEGRDIKRIWIRLA